MDFVADAVAVLDACTGTETKLFNFCSGQLEYLVAGRSNHQQLSNFVRFAFALCARASGEGVVGLVCSSCSALGCATHQNSSSTQTFETTELDELNVFAKLDELWLHLRREMGLEYRFPASRLRKGRGEEVCRVLYDLSRLAIEHSGLPFDAPDFQPTEPSIAAVKTEEADDDEDGDEDEDDGVREEEGSLLPRFGHREEEEEEDDDRHSRLPRSPRGTKVAEGLELKVRWEEGGRGRRGGITGTSFHFAHLSPPPSRPTRP